MAAAATDNQATAPRTLAAATLTPRVRHALDNQMKTVLFDLMKEHDRPRLTSGIWERALDNGDELAASLIERAIKALGASNGYLYRQLLLQIVVLEMPRHGEVFLQPVGGQNCAILNQQ